MAIATVPAKKAAAIIDLLQKQANQILASVLKTKLEQFTVGSLGNMPYYWQNPNNLLFNGKTYDWISSALAPNTKPAEQKDVFTNKYITAITAISYSLSHADQIKLNEAHGDAQDQQGALLRGWKSAFGSLPSGQTPINEILNTIQTEWTTQKDVTLMDIQESINLNQLLDKTPPAGKPLLPMLSNYLNALGSAISLENASSLNNGYLQRATRAVQSPSDGNGGITTDGSGGKYVPAYNVSTALSDIINGLKNESNEIVLKAKIERSSSSEFRVTVDGGTSFTIPVLDWFDVGFSGNAHYFRDEIATSDNTVEMTMTYTGVTLVSFGPAAFQKAGASKNWYFMEPILDAIKNEGKDVSGYKFSPKPSIDFSKNGPFGYLTNVAIANYPSVTIKVTSASYKRIQTTFSQQTQVKVSFLGIPLGSTSESTYSNKVTTDAQSQSITITLDPPPELVAGQREDAVGWVLGVNTEYPAA